MPDTYFSRLLATTPTRVWVNNPTEGEVRLSLASGAVGCTTNPAFGGGLLKRAPGEILPLIAQAAATEPDDERAAAGVQQRLVARILAQFRTIYEQSEGRLGYVSLQGPPEADHDAAEILVGAREARALGPNCIPKIPATEPGLEAFDALVGDGEPTCVTEVFSLAQVVETCERYLRVAAATGRRPPFVMAPITGVFGDHLRKVAARDGITADPALIEWAGIAFARAAARLVAERNYPVTLLFGGARTTLDLTGLVGSRHQATINWSTFAEVLEENPPVRRTIDDPVPDGVVDALTTDFDEFRQAMRVDGLRLDEFEAFGPVQHFRDNFVAGWSGVLGAIRQTRESLLPSAV